jgi:hypothetical protein
VTITITPISYLVSDLPEDDPDSQVWRLTIEKRGPGDSWAVIHHAYCLSRTGKWDYEPLPSSRTPTFLKRHRFTLAEASIAARRELPKLNINGLRVENGKLVKA